MGHQDHSKQECYILGLVIWTLSLPDPPMHRLATYNLSFGDFFGRCFIPTSTSWHNGSSWFTSFNCGIAQRENCRVSLWVFSWFMSCWLQKLTLLKKNYWCDKKKFPMSMLRKDHLCLAWQEESPIKCGPFLSPPRKKALVFIFCKQSSDTSASFYVVVITTIIFFFYYFSE